MDVARIHILVVDDLVDAADTTVDLLSIWGYDALACYTGASALESACIRRPDAVLLDLAMPRMDGFQFAGLFHELPECGLVPLIALSGYSSHAYRASAREVGIGHYLLKPADPKFLKDLLARETVAAVLSSLREDTVRRVAVELPRLKSRVVNGLAPQLCSAAMTSKGCVGM
jgi:CheY-like chemotaxis protein